MDNLLGGGRSATRWAREIGLTGLSARKVPVLAGRGQAGSETNAAHMMGRTAPHLGIALAVEASGLWTPRA